MKAVLCVMCGYIFRKYTTQKAEGFLKFSLDIEVAIFRINGEGVDSSYSYAELALGSVSEVKLRICDTEGRMLTNRFLKHFS